ncbi:hypothetical protein KY289_017034 [Solanum tuberosum]|uniref:RNA-directed DNA polymerase (Reverse transcriptase) n=1 Tax=Solanum tuberosum TaxID=4113 RepID=M1D298_SOLTU|nr:hypothetical protein KY284_016829 [Solanum tuberosum]KAH0689676.1 hypothetical protein KY289_017034 [Solanum tuberosum]
MATDPMENLWRKLRMLKSPLKDLNKEEFKGIEMKLSKARMDLQQVQDQLTRNGSDTLILLEKKILQDLEKWSNIEESVLKQKSRAKWILLGDGNNQYFSAVIKERVNRKQILILTSLTGVILSEQKDIKEEILTFYKSLLGSAAQTLPAVNSVIMRKGPVLNHQQGLQLCRPVTDEEIHAALVAIGDDKAPGVDGYNAYFNKKSWPVIKEDIIHATKDFFSSGIMLKVINCTSITLVPKIPNHSTVKEYRPIACCTVLYKNIAKVLTSKLQEVISSVISEAQLGFIPGRKIAENIILATELVKANQRKHISLGVWLR